MIKDIIDKVILEISPSLYKKKVFHRYNNILFKDLEKSKLKPEPFLIKYLVAKNKTVIDVGCHLGEFLHLGIKELPAENFHAFEPNTESFEKLKKAFGKSHIYNIALSNKNGILEFKVPKIKGKSVDTRGTLEVDFKEQDEIDSTISRVEARTLDSFIEKHFLGDVGLIKIDVEGHELSVLEGAKKTIKTFLPVIIAELEQRHYKQNLNQIIDQVKGTEYLCYYFDVRRMDFVEVQGDIENIQLIRYHKVNPALYINNFIFIPAKSKLIESLSQISNELKHRIH